LIQAVALLCQRGGPNQASKIMTDAIHLETPTDVKRALGAGGTTKPKLSLYDQAWEVLEAADLRGVSAREICGFDPARLDAGFTKPKSQAAAYMYARYWTEARRARWHAAHASAVHIANEAVEASPAVQKARKLADVACVHGDVGDFRAYAKAVAARIETEASVWAVIYGRNMPREFWGD
jgi:hypothetical protein